jgi:hypothetical protein
MGNASRCDAAGIGTQNTYLPTIGFERFSYIRETAGKSFGQDPYRTKEHCRTYDVMVTDSCEGMKPETVFFGDDDNVPDWNLSGGPGVQSRSIRKACIGVCDKTQLIKGGK